MNDNFEKLKLYFKMDADYWELVDKDPLIKCRIGYYPISFKKRLYQNHYTNFDKEGIPMFHSKSGELVHFCTGMCSFAFAHWEEYLNSGKYVHAEEVIKVAEYLISMTIKSENGGLMIYDFESDTDIINKRDGTSCAMNQAEAISVLCRAFLLTNNDQYINTAIKLAIPFNYFYGKNGVVKKSFKDNCLWFLEGGKMILNGHIYSLFGLFELWNLTKLEKIKVLFDKGEECLIKSLPLFDKGDWSWYWLDKPNYIASAMYHNLHVVQLEALYKITGKEIYMDYSRKFLEYSKSPIKRFRSGIDLFYSKIKK